MAAPPDEPIHPPSFAAGYPDDAELGALVTAFASGDHARVRGEAPRLAATAREPAVAAAARDLAGRLAPDPVARALVAATLGLLAFLVAWFEAHARH